MASLGSVLLLSTTLSVPFVAQRKDTCAAASLAMVLHYWGADVSHDEIAATLLEPQLHGIVGSRLEALPRASGSQRSPTPETWPSSAISSGKADP